MIVPYEPRFQDAALKLGGAMHAESRYRDLQYSEKKVLALLQNPNVYAAFSIASPSPAKDWGVLPYPPSLRAAPCAGVPKSQNDLGIEETIVGFFIGIVQPLWFSEQKTGFDLALYILPEHRGGTYAVRLIKAFEAFCAFKGCVEVNLSSSAEISTELARGLYARLGYQECGFISRKDV